MVLFSRIEAIYLIFSLTLDIKVGQNMGLSKKQNYLKKLTLPVEFCNLYVVNSAKFQRKIETWLIFYNVKSRLLFSKKSVSTKNNVKSRFNVKSRYVKTRLHCTCKFALFDGTRELGAGVYSVN